MDKVELQNLRQREVQMIGAAISRRDWHELETAYNQLRDKIDQALITRPATTIETLQAQLAARDAEIGRLREALAAKPWPPSDAELREMLAVIVGAWWSQSTANVIRTRRLTVEDVKGTYAIRDVLAPYIARAALGQGEG